MTEQELLKGLIIKAQSGFFTVETERGPIVSKVRGILLKERKNTDPVAIGDRVTISLVEIQQNDVVSVEGVIEEVQPRARAFTRQAPSPGGRTSTEQIDREQVIIANPDQIVFVFSCAEPEPSFRMLDRFLVIAEHAEIPVLICANKVDLVKRGDEILEHFGLYNDFGYPVIFTSATGGKGIGKLRKALEGKISALTGPSGAGKTSLLNAIQPGLGLAVRSISQATGEGRHTTVAPELFFIGKGSYVADTPGVRAIGLYNIEPSEIDGYFRDILPYIHQCRFKDCRHETEPGCAVLQAVDAGDIYYDRYESYLKLRAEVEEIYYRC
ncbi:MAG: ribosome small subunit-dependent GTPase A [Anaerolineae bacterium]|nr:ribosome small subunit-dependent GTPase A [Anaerolineae bacterium]